MCRGAGSPGTEGSPGVLARCRPPPECAGRAARPSGPAASAQPHWRHRPQPTRSRARPPTLGRARSRPPPLEQEEEEPPELPAPAGLASGTPRGRGGAPPAAPGRYAGASGAPQPSVHVKVKAKLRLWGEGCLRSIEREGFPHFPTPSKVFRHTIQVNSHHHQ